jgi:Tol biopolymer transport system component
VNRDGSNPVQLSEPPIYPVNPRWSPDGTQILFMDFYSPRGQWLSYTVASEGGSPWRILPDDNGQQVDPNWSPDGNKIVFTSGLWSDPKPQDLRVLDLTSRQVTVVPESVGMWSPRWSTDGRYLVAVSSDQPSLRIFDFETQQWRILLKKAPNELPGLPAWSRDSQFICFLRNTGERGVYRIPAKGGEAERIADLKDLHLTGRFGFWMELDPTGAPMVLRDIGSDDIYALTLETK